jgi:hypothetical protein
MTQPDIWQSLEAELDLWSLGSVRLWLRDDDAVAPSPALDRLAALSEGFALPVLLAVIPMLAEPALAGALKAMPSLLPCQHGCWHRNHAPAGGKKSEFGAERAAGAVRAEIGLARQRLGDLLGPALLPVFVPPWNRIDRGVAALLPELGFAGLSCFRGFTLGEAGGPALANTDIDVMDWHGGRVGRPAEALAAEVAAQLAGRRQQRNAQSRTLGLLLHHRDHDETAWNALEALLSRLCAHPAVQRTDPRALLVTPTFS